MHVLIGQHALQTGDARVFQKPNQGLDARCTDDQVGLHVLAVGQTHLERLTGCAGLNGLDLGACKHLHAFGLAPVANHAACGGPHHARHHAVAHLHHTELDAACGQRLHDDAADEACAQLQHARPFDRALHDLARVVQRPAVVYARAAHARYGRVHRHGTGGDQQPIKLEGLTVVEHDTFVCHIHLLGASLNHIDFQIREVRVAFAKVCPAFRNIAHEQVRNGHTRIGRLGLVADHGDGVMRCLLADRLCCNNAGRTSAKDEVMGHGATFRKRKAAWGGPLFRGCLKRLRGNAYSPKRVLVAAVGRPSGSQPRTS